MSASRSHQGVIVAGSILGNRVLRKEDPKFLTTGGKYVDDLLDEPLLANAAHVTYVRSSVAHGVITNIDTSAALAMPGVIAIFTAADLGLQPVPSPFNPMVARGLLAIDKVRYVGEPIAAVITELSNQGEDAAEAVIVDYDVPVRSFCAVGDSVTENGGYQQYYLDSWSARAVLAKSSPSAPISYYNCGMSSQNSETYFAQFANLVASGMVFTDVMFPNFSINDFSPVYVFNQYDTQRYKQRLLKAMDICRAMGARVYIWTTYYDTAPSMAGQTTALAALAEMNTWTRNLCASGAATLVDINAIWSVGTMLGGDGIHPSLVGIKASAPVLGAVL